MPSGSRANRIRRGQTANRRFPAPPSIRANSSKLRCDRQVPKRKRKRVLWYQLKGQQSRIGNSITDGAYAAMMNAIRHDETPNFYFMQYELATWRVKNLLLVPSFAFPPSAIIKRAPLSSTARRAGWVGCNIALSRIPIEARIAIVTESSISPESNVREKFRRVKPLKEISVTQRGWTLDVLNAIRRLVSEGRAPRDPNFSGQSGTRITRPSGEFTTADPAMRDLHP